MAQHRLGGTGSQHIAVIDRVAAGQRRVDDGHGLRADMGPPGGGAQVHHGVEQLPQPQMLRQRGGCHQPGVGHQPPSSKITPIRSKLCDDGIEKVLPNWGRVSGVVTVILPVQGHHFADTPPSQQPHQSVDPG